MTIYGGAMTLYVILKNGGKSVGLPVYSEKKKNQCSIHTLQQELTNVEMTHSHWIVSFMGMTTGMLVNVMLIFTNSDWRWEIILAVCEVTEYFQRTTAVLPRSTEAVISQNFNRHERDGRQSPKVKHQQD